MNASVALHDAIQQRGIILFLDGNGLGFDAPKGVMTDADLGLLRANKAGLVALLRDGEAFVQTHGTVLQAAGWCGEEVWSDSGLQSLLRAGGRMEGIRPWRIVFRAVDGTRRALLRSGRWLEEADLNEMEQEEFFTLAGRHMADGLSQDEADARAAREIER